MRTFFFLQTLNLYPNKQKYKVNKRNTLLQETRGKKGNKRKKEKLISNVATKKKGNKRKKEKLIPNVATTCKKAGKG
jgi:hypothetical protein